MKREVRVELRCTPAERALWRRLAHPYSLSEYIRQLLLKEQARTENWRVEE